MLLYIVGTRFCAGFVHLKFWLLTNEYLKKKKNFLAKNANVRRVRYPSGEKINIKTKTKRTPPTTTNKSGKNKTKHVDSLPFTRSCSTCTSCVRVSAALLCRARCPDVDRSNTLLWSATDWQKATTSPSSPSSTDACNVYRRQGKGGNASSVSSRYH